MCDFVEQTEDAWPATLGEWGTLGVKLVQHLYGAATSAPARSAAARSATALRSVVRHMHIDGEPLDEARWLRNFAAMRRVEQLEKLRPLPARPPLHSAAAASTSASASAVAVAVVGAGAGAEMAAADSDGDEGSRADGSLAWVDGDGRTFDVRRVLLYWLNQPDNSALSEDQLRLKVIALHGVDRLARRSTLAGTLRALRQRRVDTTFEFTAFEVWAPKGRAGEVVTEKPGVATFPACERVCTTAATMAYIERTRDRGQQIANAQRAAASAASGEQLRELDRSRQGHGEPLFIAVSGARPQVALLTSTLGARLAEVARRAGFAGASGHAIRHAAASTLIALGGDRATVRSTGMWTAESKTLERVYETQVGNLVSEAEWDAAAARWWRSLTHPAATAVRIEFAVRTLSATPSERLPLAWRLRADLLLALQRQARAHAQDRDGRAGTG